MEKVLNISVKFLALTLLISGCSLGTLRPDRAPSAPSGADNSVDSASKGAGSHEQAQKGEAPERGQEAANIAKKNTEANAEFHFSLAQAYVTEGNPDRAIEEYKLALMYDPNSALIHARIASEYVKKGMLSAALEECKEAVRLDPNFADARLMLAGLYSASHETELALAEYNTILKKSPANEEAIIYKSQVLLEAERADEALAVLKGYVKRAGDSALGWYYLGRAEQRMDHVKEATKAFRRALDLKPGFTQAGLALGLMYEEKGMNREAVAVYKDLYDDAQDLTAANRLATIYLKEEKYKEAIPYLEAIQGSDPDDLNVRVKLGLIQIEMKRYDEAIATFKEILKKSPDADRVHYYLGSVYEETKRFDEAVSEFKLVEPSSKLYGDSALHVAYLYKQVDRKNEAREFIKEAIRKSPKIPGFYIFQASLEEEAKQYDKAIGILESALGIFPDDEKVRYYLGSLYDRQGRTDMSIAQMEAILKTNPDNVDALNYIGYTWTIQGVRLDDAEKVLRRALSLKPDNGYIQDSWGWYLFVRGRVSEAVVELEKAAKLRPDEPTIIEHLADVYLKSNLQEKAIEQYRLAAKLTEDVAARQKILAKIDNVKQEILRAGRNVPPERLPASSGTPKSDPKRVEPLVENR